MTASERLEYERREAIRAARYEAFCARALAEVAKGEAEGRRVLEERLEQRARQEQLDFAI